MSWLVLVGWIAGWALLWRLPRVGAGRPAEALDDGFFDHVAGRVAVIVPARNEADRLPLLLASLARQTRPPARVVVVDDGSDDGTAEVAQRFAGVDVVTAPPVPEGWTGKSWACATGVGASDDDVLVFLDADVELADDALAAVLADWNRHRGLLSVQPHHHIRRPVEALSLPFNVITMMAIGVGAIVPTRRQWAAAGPCLVASRSDYELAGGHAAIRNEVAEDLALADRFVAVGLPVHCLAGGERLRFRMYRNLRGVVQGWGKNVATGARRTPPLRGVATFAWVAALLAIALEAFQALPVVGNGTALSTTAALYAAVTVQVAVLGRQVGRFGFAAALWPILVTFFVVVFAWSSLRTLVVRQVTWSGRTIRVATRH